MVIFKLMENNIGQCLTSFFKFNDSNEVMDEPIFLNDLIDNKFEGRFEVKVDPIFINKFVVSIQLKLSCVCIKPIQAKVKITMRYMELPRREFIAMMLLRTTQVMMNIKKLKTKIFILNDRKTYNYNE